MTLFTTTAPGAPPPVRRAARMPLGLASLGVVLAVALAACGGGSPVSAPRRTPSTSAPPTAAHRTPAALLPTLDRALLEQTHGQYAAAVVDLLSIVKADPTSQIAWYDLGVIAHLHAEDTEAIDDYEAALAGDPGYVPALFNLAVLETAGQPKAAAALYRDVIRLQPANAATHLNLGFVLLSLGSRAAAEVELADAVRLDPALASRVPAGDRGTK